jgi:hypothetical protein
VIVADLIPGQIHRHGIPGLWGVYICQQKHPLYISLQLTVWRLENGNYFFDALREQMELITDPIPQTPEQRLNALRWALGQAVPKPKVPTH